MIIKNLQQKTSAWYDHRKQYINATEIASIMDLNPFKSLQELIHDKLFGSAFITNQFVEHGNLTEPLARSFFETTTKLRFQETIFVDDDNKMFSASLDGFNHQHQIILEIKCPFRNHNNQISSSWNKFLTTKEIPIYYWTQVQCQLYCSKAKFAYFLVYFNDDEYYVERIYQDNNFIQSMISKSKTYLKLLSLNKQELLNSKHLKNLTKIKL